MMDRLHRLFFVSLLCMASVGGCKFFAKSSPQSAKITVKIVHDPELKSYMRKMARAFVASKGVLPNGTGIRIQLIPEPPLSATRKISSGILKVHGWLAPSTSLVSLANASLRNLGPRQKDCQLLFVTPIVAATTQDLSAKLQAQDGIFSWKKLGFLRSPLKETKASSSPLYFSHVSPIASVSGLGALLELSYVASGFKNVLRENEVISPEFLDALG
ncbi:MAG: hypothetical protein D6808_00325, partial [Candidatus Dadabacteria bacterium]